MSVDGVLVVDKPAGPTSHDVVATARRALRIRRIGHTGTLDPLASGVLALVVGNATRLAQYLSATDKEYEAVVQFGVETDSYDRAGRVTRQSGRAPAREELMAALDRFRGSFDQMPPAYSAKKLDGDRAYDLARNAKPIALTAAPVSVRALDLVSFDPPNATLRVVSSAGFYVRSLAHDLGQAVGTGAMLQALVRRRSGDFLLDVAVPFGDVANGTYESLIARLMPMEQLLPDWPAVQLTVEGATRIEHGQELRPADWRGAGPPAGSDRIRLISSHGRLLGLANPSKIAGFLHPVVVFRYN